MGYPEVEMSVFDEFEKKHEYAVCIDSDGCAMDTMTIKHVRAFGPCLVREWKLEDRQEEILERWNVINLYSRTRGINRFKGLAMMLKEVDASFTKIPGVDEFCTWADNAKELSNGALKGKLQENEIFQKALSWSMSVNKTVDALPDELLRPFEGVREAFDIIRGKADIVVVSSANPEAVRNEWGRYGLLPYVDLICTQEIGSKAFCISKVLEKGYDPGKVLMCGDAPGDLDAAKTNRVLYFPILAGRETESWKLLKDEAFALFLDGRYSGAYQDERIREFNANLGV